MALVTGAGVERQVSIDCHTRLVLESPVSMSLCSSTIHWLSAPVGSPVCHSFIELLPYLPNEPVVCLVVYAAICSYSESIIHVWTGLVFLAFLSCLLIHLSSQRSISLLIRSSIHPSINVQRSSCYARTFNKLCKLDSTNNLSGLDTDAQMSPLC